jgi:DNA polymerase-3 subunit gamma/tau
LADKLSVPALARAWQMLLKGVGEVETAPDRRAAAEMVLIRLCHVSDLPPPGDLVRRLTGNPGGASSSLSVPPNGGGGGARAVANGGMQMEAGPAPAQAVPQLRQFRDVVALVAEKREPLLHAQLLHSVHLVRFAPPIIELRPEPDAPRDLSSRLAALLSEATGTRWTIAVSKDAGEPTIAVQSNDADKTRRSTVADHPLVRAILEAFPGARIETVVDASLDAYGLPPMPDLPPDMPDFAPLEAEPAGEYFNDDLPEELDA